MQIKTAPHHLSLNYPTYTQNNKTKQAPAPVLVRIMTCNKSCSGSNPANLLLIVDKSRIVQNWRNVLDSSTMDHVKKLSPSLCLSPFVLHPLSFCFRVLVFVFNKTSEMKEMTAYRVREEEAVVGWGHISQLLIRSRWTYFTELLFVGGKWTWGRDSLSN